VLAEDEVLVLFDNVLLVLRVILVEGVKQLSLDQSLLEEALLVLQYLERYKLLSFVVESADHNAEGALA